MGLIKLNARGPRWNGKLRSPGNLDWMLWPVGIGCYGPPMELVPRAPLELVAKEPGGIVR